MAQPDVTTPAVNQLLLTWSGETGVEVVNDSLTGWSLAYNSGFPPAIPLPTILAFNAGVAANTIIVATTEQYLGQPYTITIPVNRIFSNQGKPNVAGVRPFIGYAICPQIYITQFVNDRSCLVTFNEAMDVPSATNALNYSIPGLSVYSVVALSQTQFTVNTSRMVPGFTYTLTITGVADAAGNVIL